MPWPLTSHDLALGHPSPKTADYLTLNPQAQSDVCINAILSTLQCLWHVTSDLCSPEEDGLWYMPDTTEHHTQSNPREDVGIVALAWVQGFVLEGNGFEGAATGKHASALQGI